MKRLTLTDPSESAKSNVNDQLAKTLRDAIESGDKTIEIRPANRSGGSGLLRLLLFVGVALGISYWLRKTQRPSDMIQRVTRETADRTERVTEQAAEAIREGGETAAERVEEGSEKASERVEETGESAATTTEEAGETAAEKADESDLGSSES